MTLKVNSLVTLDQLLNSMQLTANDFSLNFLTIYNSSADASAATAVVTSTGITLTVTGGTSAHSNTLTWAAYTTLGALITAIEALAKNWVVNRLGGSDQPSSGFHSTSVSCLLVANIKTLSGQNTLLLHDYINWASQKVDDYCGRTFISASYTDYYDGIGHADIIIDQYPISAVTSIKLWDYQNNTAQYTYTQYTEYDINLTLGILHIIGGLPYGRRMLQVVYTAGYAQADLPAAIKEACLRLIKVQYNRRNKEGLQVESVGGNVNTQFDLSEIPRDVAGLLDGYRKMDKRIYK